MRILASRYAPNRLIRTATVLLSLVLGGCDGSATTPNPVATPAPASSENLPPSFLDKPPQGPTSDTMILSGGTLITADELFDAVVVVQNGQVIAAGKRGTVPVPADSIGIDASGKFIVAVDPERPLIGGPAELLLYDAHPGTRQPPTVYARVTAGQWQLASDSGSKP